MKIKFTVYPWFGLDFKWQYGSRHQNINLLPVIVFDYWQTEHEKEEGGWWFTIQFCWFIFGITFDWRKGE